MTYSDFLSNFDAVFFDLDGTLVGLSDEVFEVDYVKLIAKRFSAYIEPEHFVKALWQGTDDMMNHKDPSKPVLETFFDTFTEATGIDRDRTYTEFDDFYRKEFNLLKELCEPVPEAKQLVKTIKEQDKKIVLATLPIFPEVATRNRCNWSDLDYDDFNYVSHAQNSTICKPYPEYFQNLSKIIDVEPTKILMVGNDYLFDMAASNVGMKTWMIDKFQSSLESKGKYKIDYEGSLAKLLEMIQS